MTKGIGLGLFIVILATLSYIGLSFIGYPDINGSQIRKDILLVDVLGGETTVEQTIIPVKPYLSAVEVYVDVPPQRDIERKKYKLYFVLEEQNGKVIAFGEKWLDNNLGTDSVYFSFAPQPSSDAKIYTLTIKTDASVGYINLWTSQFDAYPNGHAFINSIALPFDFAFNTYYKPNVLSWIDFFGEKTGNRFALLLMVLLAFGGMGFCVLSIFEVRLDEVELIAYSIVFGIVIPPIFIFVLGLFGVKFTDFIVMGLFVFLIIAAWVKKIVRHTKKTILNKNKHLIFELWIFGVMLLLALISRTFQISDLVVPNWLDGLVHQKMAQTIQERGYVDYLVIYPKGFHANIIWISSLLGIEIREAILLVGQFLSVASGTSLYILARRFVRPPFSLVALMLFWFWSPYPSFLIFWARYPFLQGLTILPALILFLMTKNTGKPRDLVLMGILLFGIGITYYGALMMFFSFVVSYYLILAYHGKSSFLIKNYKYFFISVFPIIIVLYVRMVNALNHNVKGQDSSVNWLSDAVTTLNVSMRGGGAFIWIAAAMGLIVAVVNRKKILPVLSAWILIQLLLQFVQEDAGITVSSVSNALVMISIPLVIYTAYLFQSVAAPFLKFNKVMFLLVVLVLSFWGAYISSAQGARSYILYTYADQVAFDWIENNIAEDSVFCVNSFYWGDDLSPSDGGGWINSLLGNKTVLCDGFNFSNIDYIYIGNGLGFMNPEELISQYNYLPVYHQDGVYILKKRPLN